MYCKNCGKEISEHAVVCIHCGKSLSSIHNGKNDSTLEDWLLRLILPINRSYYALAAGYLGILSPFLIPAPFAILFGFLGIADIKKNPNKYGMGRAIFGIIMGICSLPCELLLTYFLR